MGREISVNFKKRQIFFMNGLVNLKNGSIFAPALRLILFVDKIECFLRKRVTAEER